MTTCVGSFCCVFFADGSYIPCLSKRVDRPVVVGNKGRPPTTSSSSRRGSSVHRLFDRFLSILKTPTSHTPNQPVRSSLIRGRRYSRSPAFPFHPPIPFAPRPGLPSRPRRSGPAMRANMVAPSCLGRRRGRLDRRQLFARGACLQFEAVRNHSARLPGRASARPVSFYLSEYRAKGGARGNSRRENAACFSLQPPLTLRSRFDYDRRRKRPQQYGRAQC